MCVLWTSNSGSPEDDRLALCHQAARSSYRFPDVRSKAMQASLHEKCINVEGSGYFVRNASTTPFGACGEKRNSIMPGEAPYLDVFKVIPAPKLAEMKLVTALLDVTFADAKGINLLAEIEIPGLSGQVGVKVSDINESR